MPATFPRQTDNIVVQEQPLLNLRKQDLEEVSVISLAPFAKLMVIIPSFILYWCEYLFGHKTRVAYHRRLEKFVNFSQVCDYVKMLHRI
jgi:hypothetical protein